MAVNIDPIFPIDYHILGQTRINTANANRDGTGTIASLVTGATSGTLVESIVVKAEVTTTAGMIRLFALKGGTYYLFFEQPVAAITASATVGAFQVEIPINKILGSGEIIAVSTERAEMFSVTAWGGDYE